VGAPLGLVVLADVRCAHNDNGSQS
jgi:hypothetical protein